MQPREIPTETKKPQFDDGEYTDQSWELVGEVKFTEEFEPMQLEELDGRSLAGEPMFEDYGGNELKGSGPRFHLPTEQAKDIVDGLKEEEDPNRVVMRIEELEAMKAEAFAAGRAEAEQEAEAKQKERFATVEAQMSQLLQDIQTQLNEQLLVVEKNAVQFALDVAEKVIFRTVEINPEYIATVIKEAIDLTGSGKIKRVRVSKDDFEFIEYAGIAKSLKEFDGSWAFEADEGIKAGCVVDTSAGEIDYQIDKSWERVKENVVKVIR